MRREKSEISQMKPKTKQKLKELWCLILNFGHQVQSTYQVHLETDRGDFDITVEAQCGCGKFLIDNRDYYEEIKKYPTKTTKIVMPL